MEALRGYERPPAALRGGRPRRPRQRHAPRGRLRHHRRQRDHGRALPCHQHRRLERAPFAHHRRLYLRRTARHRRRPQGRGRDGGAFEGCAQAQSGADAGTHPGAHPRRSLCQHRPRLQQRAGHAHGPETGRLRRHRGRLWRGPRRGEVPRHQVPHGGPAPRGGGGGGHGAGAEAARRPEKGGAENRRPRGAGKGPAEPAAPRVQHLSLIHICSTGT